MRINSFKERVRVNRVSKQVTADLSHLVELKTPLDKEEINRIEQIEALSEIKINLNIPKDSENKKNKKNNSSSTSVSISRVKKDVLQNSEKNVWPVEPLMNKITIRKEEKIEKISVDELYKVFWMGIVSPVNIEGIKSEISADKRVKNGFFKVMYRYGDVYFGEFKENLKNGVGMYYYKEKKIYYVGEWKNDVKEGDGYVMRKKNISKGFWKNNVNQMIRKDRNKYLVFNGDYFKGKFDESYSNVIVKGDYYSKKKGLIFRGTFKFGMNSKFKGSIYESKTMKLLEKDKFYFSMNESNDRYLDYDGDDIYISEYVDIIKEETLRKLREEECLIQIKEYPLNNFVDYLFELHYFSLNSKNFFTCVSLNLVDEVKYFLGKNLRINFNSNRNLGQKKFHLKDYVKTPFYFSETSEEMTQLLLSSKQIDSNCFSIGEGDTMNFMGNFVLWNVLLKSTLFYLIERNWVKNLKLFLKHPKINIHFGCQNLSVDEQEMYEIPKKFKSKITPIQFAMLLHKFDIVLLLYEFGADILECKKEILKVAVSNIIFKKNRFYHQKYTWNGIEKNSVEKIYEKSIEIDFNKRKVLKIIENLNRGWSVERHLFFPKYFRKTIWSLLAVSFKSKTYIPIEVIQHIISFIPIRKK